MLRTAVYLFVLACVVAQGFTVAQRIAQRAQQLVALDAVQRQLAQVQQAQPVQAQPVQLIDLGLPQ